MAQLDYINLGGRVHLGVNVSDTVGVGGRNDFNDVAVVQAMFVYIADGLGAEAIGLLPHLGFAIPKVSGKYDADTANAIASFQIRYAGQLLIGKKADWQIHPASYKGRVLKSMWKPLMTITYLHVCALASAERQGDFNYVNEIKSLLPMIWGPVLRPPAYPRPRP